jgi:hypothetical protein
MCLDIQAHTIKMYIQGLFLTDIPETHFKAVNTELEGRRDHAVSLYCFPAPHPSQKNLNKFDDFYLFLVSVTKVAFFPTTSSVDPPLRGSVKDFLGDPLPRGCLPRGEVRPAGEDLPGDSLRSLGGGWKYDLLRSRTESVSCDTYWTLKMLS